MKLSTLSFSAILLLSACPLSADERVENWLKRMDTDKDGTLALAETSGLMQRNFKNIDANEDGNLDKAELEALSKRIAERTRPDRPGRPAQGDGSATDEAIRSRLPEGVTFEPNVAYREGEESERWKLDLFYPEKKEGEAEAKRPGIVFIHGGGWRSGDKRRGYFLQGAIEYAGKGYVTATINYRLTGTDAFPACVEDVKCAVRWLRANAGKYGLDPERIGAYGNSAGAHLVCMLGLVGKDAGLEGDGGHPDQPSLVQAVCASAAPTDFVRREGGLSRLSQPGGLLAGPEDSLKERAKLASPVSHVSKNAPPFLLIHGTKDGTVNVQHSDWLAEALEKAGVEDVTYLRIEGAGHGVFNQHADKTKPAMEEFFKRTLAEKEESVDEEDSR